MPCQLLTGTARNKNKSKQKPVSQVVPTSSNFVSAPVAGLNPPQSGAVSATAFKAGHWCSCCASLEGCQPLSALKAASRSAPAFKLTFKAGAPTALAVTGVAVPGGAQTCYQKGGFGQSYQVEAGEGHHGG